MPTCPNLGPDVVTYQRWKVIPVRYVIAALRPDDELATWMTLRSSGEAYLRRDIALDGASTYVLGSV